MADELVSLKVDVLFTPGIDETLAAKNATSTIPIVFLTMGDPVAAGLVDSLARPGGNITGFTYIGAGVGWQTIGAAQGNHSQTLPCRSTLESTRSGLHARWKESQLSARELGLRLYSMEVSGADKYEGAFDQATKARIAAVAVTQGAEQFLTENELRT